MDNINYINMLEQLKNDGYDLNALGSAIQTMASNNKTPYLKLNQWQSSDKPVMKNFNDDNVNIDEGFRVLSEHKADKAEVNAALAKKADKHTALKWHAATLLNGYTEGTKANLPPVYAKDEYETVFLSGTISRETKPEPGDSILQLPAGFRPGRSIPLILCQINGVATWAYIDVSGTVRFQFGAIPVNYVPLSPTAFNIVFKAAQ